MIAFDLFLFAGCVLRIWLPGYLDQYSVRDYWLNEALSEIELSDYRTYLANDGYVRQQMMFFFGDLQLEEVRVMPEIVIVQKGDVWIQILSQQELAEMGVYDRNLLYENELYAIYH